VRRFQKQVELIDCIGLEDEDEIALKSPDTTALLSPILMSLSWWSRGRLRERRCRQEKET
jgi:hypothetical protein